MTKSIDLLFAARPMLHLPVWSVYLVSLYYLDTSTTPGPGSHLVVLAGLSLVVAGAYYLNQIYDFESDRINDKLGFLQRGMASKQLFWFLFAVTSVAGLAAVAVVSTRLLIPVGLQFLLGVAYSVPPMRFKDRPWLGLLTNACCFGLLVPVVALMAAMPGQSLQMLLASRLGLYFFLAVAVIHVVTTLPDREGDAAVGKRTVAVVLSPAAARLLAAVLLLAATGVALWIEAAALLYLSIISLWIVLAGYVVRSSKVDLLAAKLPLLALTLLAGYHYPYYLLFVVALILSTRIYYRRRFGISYPRAA